MNTETLSRQLTVKPTLKVDVLEVQVQNDETDDMREAIDLLKKVTILFDYVTNPDMCPRVSKRELLAMERMSGRVCEFLDEVEEYYKEG